MEIIHVLSTVLASVFLFLFSITKFSSQLQMKAGERFKDIIRSVTSTPIRGTLAGTLVTALVQSSTATTVMVVSLVNAGLLTFGNSLGVIFGANIGSVITSQLLAYNLSFIAPYIVIFGFLLQYTKSRFAKWGKPIFYFGLIFFSFAIVTQFVEPLQSSPAILEIFSKISGLGIALGVGILLTVLFQSSTITTGLSLVLVAQGLLTFDQAVGIVLGANIGTTSTALIAAIPMDIMARRAAVAHFLFNLVGVLIIIPFLSPFSSAIEFLGGSSAQQVANMHLVFNVLSAIIFLAFIRPFERLVTALVK
jgi:phosphate:Na+ symporter